MTNQLIQFSSIVVSDAVIKNQENVTQPVTVVMETFNGVLKCPHLHQLYHHYHNGENIVSARTQSRLVRSKSVFVSWMSKQRYPFVVNESTMLLDKGRAF